MSRIALAGYFASALAFGSGDLSERLQLDASLTKRQGGACAKECDPMDTAFQACLTGTTALTVCLCEASTLTLADACSACAQSSTELDANLEALYTGYGQIPSVWCNGQAPGAQGTASPGDPVPILASDAAGATVSPTASPAEDAPLGVDPTGSATASELAAASPAPLSPGVGGAANDTGVVPPSDANPLSAPSSTAAPIARVAAAFVLGLVLACMSLVTR